MLKIFNKYYPFWVYRNSFVFIGLFILFAAFSSCTSVSPKPDTDIILLNRKLIETNKKLDKISSTLSLLNTRIDNNEILIHELKDISSEENKKTPLPEPIKTIKVILPNRSQQQKIGPVKANG